ncbi:hypothetical protein MKW98_030471, partial [Papaver atlanticum]
MHKRRDLERGKRSFFATAFSCFARTVYSLQSSGQYRRISSPLFEFLSWTLLLNIVTLLSCVLGTSSIRSGLLASVQSFATDDTRGLFLWRFFLLMTGISIIIFSHMKQQ